MSATIQRSKRKPPAKSPVYVSGGTGAAFLLKLDQDVRSAAEKANELCAAKLGIPPHDLGKWLAHLIVVGAEAETLRITGRALPAPTTAKR